MTGADDSIVASMLCKLGTDLHANDLGAHLCQHSSLIARARPYLQDSIAALHGQQLGHVGYDVWL